MNPVDHPHGVIQMEETLYESKSYLTKGVRQENVKFLKSYF